MDLFRAAVLGVVQGLSEFLPISSSGHLILVPALFRWDDQGLAFDVGLHGGTLAALLAYFWRDWYVMFRAAGKDALAGRVQPRRWSEPTRLLAYLALGSVPAAVTGLLLQDTIEANLRQPWLVAILLAVVATVMLAADRATRARRDLPDVTTRDAVLVGIAQAFALFPGVSRSGATISMALFRNFTRDAAARFAFLLGTPAFVGALILQAPDLANASGRYDEVAVGFASSMLVGFAVIYALLRFLRTRTLMTFVVYRYAVAVVTLAIGAARVA